MEFRTKQEMSSKSHLKKGHKVVIIGDAFVGKTSIINCLINGSISETKPTIGSQHHNYKFINDNKKETILDIWDTAGQERFRSIIPMYYKGAKAIIVVFDVTNKDSFEGAKKWIEEIEENNKSCFIFLVGNKIDIIANRSISEDIINDYCNLKSIQFFECSAKENLNVENIFQTVGNQIPIDDLNKNQNDKNKNLKDVNEIISDNRGYCC